MIGGLLQSDNRNQSNSCPGSATCRCSARCSRRKSYQKNETDLAIIVTPRLVRPMRPGDRIRRRLDDTLPPNDVDFFLMGKTEVSARERRKPSPVSQFAEAEARPFTGHMLDLPKGDLQCRHSVKPSPHRARSQGCAVLLAGCSESSRPPRSDRARRRRRGRDQPGRADGRSVAARMPPTATSPTTASRMQSAVERYRTGRVIRRSASAPRRTYGRSRSNRGERQIRQRRRAVGPTVTPADTRSSEEQIMRERTRSKTRPNKTWWSCSPPMPTSSSAVRSDVRRQQRPIDLRGRQRRYRCRRTWTSTAPPWSIIDLDAGRDEEMAALARLMARIGDWPPVIVVTRSFDESVARTLLQMRVADFLVKPVQPVDLVRACARVAQTPSATEPPRRRSTPFCRPSAAPASRRSRSRRRCCCSTAADRAQAVDLPGRSRLPARRLSPTISTSSRGSNSRDRAAAGAARPAVARSHAVAIMPPAWP